MRTFVALTGLCLLLGCKEEVECFDPVHRVANPGGLPGARWRIADIDGDGLEDVVGFEDLGAGQWRLHPLMGRASGAPLQIEAPTTVDVGIALDNAGTELVDADGDGVVDLAAYHDDLIVLVDGPLLSPGDAREFPMTDLHAGRGHFIDFDDDGRLDFVMREDTGDNLLSFRGLADGTFEAAGNAEFDEDTWCINKFVSYEDGENDWLGVEATWACGSPSGSDSRVTLYSVEADGSFTPLGSAQWEVELFDRGITLHMAGNFVGDAAPELLINSSVRGPNEAGDLVELASVEADRRADIDGDGWLDHLTLDHGADRVVIDYGNDGERRELHLDFAEWPERVLVADVDGDGDDELVINQGDSIWVTGSLGICEI